MVRSFFFPYLYLGRSEVFCSCGFCLVLVLVVEQHEENKYAPFLQHEEKLESGNASRFSSFIVGTIPTASRGLFERMLFRVSRGNTLSQ